jgi:hypothetical protein
MPATRHGFDDVITLAWAGRYHQYPRLGGLFHPRCRDNPPPVGLATPQGTCYARVDLQTAHGWTCYAPGDLLRDDVAETLTRADLYVAETRGPLLRANLPCPGANCSSRPRPVILFLAETHPGGTHSWAFTNSN